MLRGKKCWMEDSDNRVGENGFSDSGHSITQPPLPPATNFFDQEGASYFGELEEALMQGVVGIRNDGDKKSLLLPTRPSPTLEIFPSWPMRSLQSIKENLHSEKSTNSGSAQHKISQSEHSSNPEGLEQNQHIRATDSKSYTQNKRRVGGSDADGDGKKLDAKTLRRLAQNREAARKSRLRKKAYVQQLETSRIKLAQLEQDLQLSRSQGLVFQGGGNGNGSVSSGAAMFDMEYVGWLDESYKLMNELREGLQAQLSDSDLRVIVDKCLSNYDVLFRLKAVAAKTDVFHLITGMWTTPAERCFIWMGGFRPSDLIKICMPVLDPLTEQQVIGMCSLQQSSQEAEEALSQGFEQLQQSLAGTISSGSLEDGANVSNYMEHMAMALGKLANVEVLVHQADKLRQQALHQLGRILTIRQAARCFLAIGEYYNRLRALSSIWASRRREDIVTGEGSYCPATADMQIIRQPLIQSQFSAF